jgi:hypothetical protein
MGHVVTSELIIRIVVNAVSYSESLSPPVQCLVESDRYASKIELEGASERTISMRGVSRPVCRQVAFCLDKLA